MRAILMVAISLFVTPAGHGWASEPAQKAILAAGTNTAFSHSLETAAKPEGVWRLWTDVSSWKTWDLGLKDAQMDGPMKLGSKGQITPLSGAPAEFEITAFESHLSYTLTMNLPSARLIVRRSIVSRSPTIFRHEIRFDGSQAEQWANLLGPGFRAALPPTMTQLSRLAETAAR